MWDFSLSYRRSSDSDKCRNDFGYKGTQHVSNAFPLLRQENVDLHGQRDALEIVYMKFFAFNG